MCYGWSRAAFDQQRLRAILNRYNGYDCLDDEHGVYFSDPLRLRQHTAIFEQHQLYPRHVALYDVDASECLAAVLLCYGFGGWKQSLSAIFYLRVLSLRQSVCAGEWHNKPVLLQRNVFDDMEPAERIEWASDSLRPACDDSGEWESEFGRQFFIAGCRFVEGDTWAGDVDGYG